MSVHGVPLTRYTLLHMPSLLYSMPGTLSISFPSRWCYYQQKSPNQFNNLKSFHGQVYVCTGRHFSVCNVTIIWPMAHTVSASYLHYQVLPIPSSSFCSFDFEWSFRALSMVKSWVWSDPISPCSSRSFHVFLRACPHFGSWCTIPWYYVSNLIYFLFDNYY